MTGGSRRRPCRRGIFLPLFFVLLVLMMLSSLLVSRFGSDTRRQVRRAEAYLRCRTATVAAVFEARRRVEYELQPPTDEWAADSWWRQLLPPYTVGSVAPHLPLPAPVTQATCAAERVVVGPVAIECLDRRVVNGLAQGLLRMTVGAATELPGGISLTLTREERVRFVVVRDPSVGLRIRLLPGHECVREEGE